MKNIILTILTVAAISMLMCGCRTTQVTSDSRVSDTLVIRDTLIVYDSMLVAKKEIVTTTVRIKDSTVLVVDTTGRIVKSEHYISSDRDNNVNIRRDSTSSAVRYNKTSIKNTQQSDSNRVVEQTKKRDWKEFAVVFVVGFICCLMIYIGRKKS
jgi:hypothetical protein